MSYNVAKDTGLDLLYGQTKMLPFGVPKVLVRDVHEEDPKRLFLDIPNYEVPE